MSSDRLNHLPLSQFFPFRVSLKSLSPQKQLQQQLLALLTAASVLNVSLPKAISLTRLPQTPIIYRCAIAFQLSSQLAIVPMALAEIIFSSLVMIQASQDNSAELSFTAHLIVPGWIDFQLSDRSLAIWLQWFPQQLANQNFLAFNSKKSANFEQLWLLQHTHARCCSLLRLGQQENLIKFKDIELRLINPAERSLISQLLMCVDCLENSQAANWVKLASNLCQAFWYFEKNCRIFGEVAQRTPEISQARLGLLAVVQMLLKWMYVKGTKSLPPVQL